MYSGTPWPQHLSLVIRAINMTCCNRRRPTWTYKIQFACMISCWPVRAWVISFTERFRCSQCVTQYGSPALYTPTPVTERIWRRTRSIFKSVCAFVCLSLHVCLCVFPVSTSGVAEEDEAPDTGGAADDQANGQHDAVRHLPAQPAYKDEAQDDLDPAQAVHQAVGQLAKAKGALRQRSHHGLGIF